MKRAKNGAKNGYGKNGYGKRFLDLGKKWPIYFGSKRILLLLYRLYLSTNLSLVNIDF